MSALDFYVQSLNVEITSSEALLAGAATGAFTSDVNAAMDIDLAVVKDLFRFHTDGIEILDASSSDITYRVNYTPVDLQSNPTDPVLASAWLSDVDVLDGDAITDEQTGVANQKVTFEYVRYLAKKLFNTHLGVDLFSNEEQLRNDLHTNAKAAMNTHLTALTDISNNEQNPENQNYISAEQATTGDFSVHPHPSYAILRQIISDAPSRLEDISANLVSGTESTYSEFKMPFLAGDKIYFQLKVKAANGQELATGVATIPDRTYRVRMTVV